MASTTAKIVWLHWLVSDMGISQLEPTPMFYDNESVIQTTQNLVFHECIKHIEIDCHLTRHHLFYDTIMLPFVSSSSM